MRSLVFIEETYQTYLFFPYRHFHGVVVSKGHHRNFCAKDGGCFYAFFKEKHRVCGVYITIRSVKNEKINF
jgi:hypothetical protein